MSDQLTIYGEARMTVKEVAAAMGVADRTIRRYVTKYFPEIVENGTTTLLSELQVTKIKLELEKAKNLDSVVQLPQTRLEKSLLIRQAIGLLEEEIDDLKVQAEINKPKVEFFEKVGAADGLHNMGDTAKLLGFGRNTLFIELRDRKILMKNNSPYQRYIDSGYFTVKENVVGNGFVKPQTFVTGKGLIWLENQFRPEAA